MSLARSRDKAVAAVQAAVLTRRSAEVLSRTRLTGSSWRPIPLRGRRLRRAPSWSMNGFQGRKAGHRPGRRRDDVVRGNEDVAGRGLQGEPRARALRPVRRDRHASRRTRSPGWDCEAGNDRAAERREERRRDYAGHDGSGDGDGAGHRGQGACGRRAELRGRGAEGGRALRPVGRGRGQDRRAVPAGRHRASRETPSS